MKQPLLYLCTKEEAIILKVLSSRFSVHVYYTGTDQELDNQQWKLVVFQDAEVWQQRFFQKLKKFPWLFISTRSDILGYITPKANLFGVVNIGGGNLSLWGIPKELQLYLQQPVEKIADYYFFEQQPKTYHIVYCPTGNSVHENDFKLLSFLRATNTMLTIVSDQYQAMSNAYPGFIEVVSQREWLPAFKKAHLVVASGRNAIRAMALCKPCIILGDCGIGGMVTTINYEQLQSTSFSGRKGASPGEVVPSDLLEAEIRKAFGADCKEVVQTIQERIYETYSLEKFSVMLLKEVERITNLFAMIKSRKKRFILKPHLSSVFQQKEYKGKRHIMRGILHLGELNEDMARLLEQCDGVTSIKELTERNRYDFESATILWENLYELWKEKLILFEQ